MLVEMKLIVFVHGDTHADALAMQGLWWIHSTKVMA